MKLVVTDANRPAWGPSICVLLGRRGYSRRLEGYSASSQGVRTARTIPQSFGLGIVTKRERARRLRDRT